MAALEGWGRGTWSEGAWGEYIPVSVTGIQSNTSVGTLSVVANALVTPTGVSSGVVLGTAIGEAESIYPVTGVQSNTATGTLEAQEGHGVQTTGVEINFSSGNNTLTATAANSSTISTTQSVFGGSSLRLPGSSSYVTLSEQATSITDSNFTMETFVRLDDGNQQYAPLFTNWNSTTGFYSAIWGSANEFRIYINGSLILTASSFVLDSDTWYHIAITWDGSTIKVYKDGTLAQSAAFSGTINKPFSYLTLGTNSDSVGQATVGYIDEVRLSNVVRYTTNFTPTDREFEPDANTIALVHFDGTNGSTDFPVLTSADASVSATVDAGWGRNTWGSFAWGENITIYANLVGESMSTDLGTVTTQTGTGVIVPTTGLLSSFNVGSVSLITDQNIAVTGLLSNVVLQNPTIIADGNVTTSAPGDQMDFAIGSINIDIFTQVDPTAVTSTFETGTLTMTGDANFTLTGSQANTSVGTVTVIEGTGVIVPTTGVSIQFSEGTETVSGNALVTPTGVALSIVTGNMFSTPWANVVTGASNTWTQVAA